jgi:hypothetical protein
MAENKYIRFKLSEEKPKTKVWVVVNKKSHSIIGEISWYSAWRQYTFFPFVDTVWNCDCLDTISEFLKEKNREHKSK